jgi:hypothetical protein
MATNILMIQNHGKQLNQIKKDADNYKYLFAGYLYFSGIIFSCTSVSAEKMFKMLNTKPVEWKECGKPQLKDGHQIKSGRNTISENRG